MATRRGVPILIAEKWWECPSCGHQRTTTTSRLITPMHACPRQAGLDVPLTQVNSNEGIRRGTVRHLSVEREDYIGDEVGVRHDLTGRAVMALRTERADGSNDVAVFAPTATNREN